MVLFIVAVTLPGPWHRSAPTGRLPEHCMCSSSEASETCSVSSGPEGEDSSSMPSPPASEPSLKSKVSRKPSIDMNKNCSLSK